MTEADWTEAFDPLDMLAALGRACDERRIWQYVILCLEGIGERQTAELIASRVGGTPDEAALHSRRTVLHPHAHALSGGGYSHGRKPISRSLAAQRARAGLAALESSPWLAMERITQETRHHLQRSQSAWLRCLFPGPCCSGKIDPSWRTSTVVSLTRGIHEDQAFDRLPILADALQDAGCPETAVLAHCRCLGPHVRSCFVVHLLLGE
jgi:hypothetical protein